MGFDEELKQTKRRMAQQLTEYRKAAGFTAEELAEKVGMHRTTIYKIEAGKVNSIDTLAKLLSRCGLSLDDFLSGFRSKQIPGEHQEDHRKLGVILTAGFRPQADAARAALDSIYNTVLRLKEARESPTPRHREGRGSHGRDAQDDASDAQRKPPKTGT